MVLQRGQYEVHTASDGQEALGRIADEQADLVITDVDMPLLGGVELCRALKRDSATRHVPVLMLTGLGGADDRFEGYEAGADDYMTKPFDRAELICRVRALLRLRDLYLRLERVGELR